MRELLLTILALIAPAAFTCLLVLVLLATNGKLQ